MQTSADHATDRDSMTEAGCAASHDGRHVYAARQHESALLVYAREERSGALRLVDSLADPAVVSGPTKLVLSPDDRYLYVIGSWLRPLTVFGRQPDSGRLSLVEAVNADPLNRMRGIGQPAGIAISPDGNNLYVTSIADFSLLVFARQLDTGRLRPLQTFQDDNAAEPLPGSAMPQAEALPGATIVDGLMYPRGLAVSPDGRHLYVAAYADRGIGVFQRDARDGKLEWVEVFKEPPMRSLYGLIYASGLALGPNDRNLYVASVSNALAVLDRNPATGKLTFGEVFHHGRDGVEGIGYALSVAISPTGKTVYVTGHGDSAGGGSVAVFTRDADSGRLSFVEGANAVRRPSYGLHGACWITTSPKSGYIYLSSSAKSITVFRDPADGPEESPK